MSALFGSADSLLRLSPPTVCCKSNKTGEIHLRRAPVSFCRSILCINAFSRVCVCLLWNSIQNGQFHDGSLVLMSSRRAARFALFNKHSPENIVSLKVQKWNSDVLFCLEVKCLNPTKRCEEADKESKVCRGRCRQADRLTWRQLLRPGGLPCSVWGFQTLLFTADP